MYVGWEAKAEGVVVWYWHYRADCKKSEEELRADIDQEGVGLSSFKEVEEWINDCFKAVGTRGFWPACSRISIREDTIWRLELGFRRIPAKSAAPPPLAVVWVLAVAGKKKRPSPPPHPRPLGVRALQTILGV
jgi:hypothetical protein